MYGDDLRVYVKLGHSDGVNYLTQLSNNLFQALSHIFIGPSKNRFQLLNFVLQKCKSFTFVIDLERFGPSENRLVTND